MNDDRIRFDHSLVFAHAYIFWEAEDSWFLGRICEYSEELKAHRIHYFVDNHVEWRRLGEFQLRIKHTAEESVLRAEAWRRRPENVPVNQRHRPSRGPPVVRPPIEAAQRAMLLNAVQLVPRVPPMRMAKMAQDSGLTVPLVRNWIEGLRAWNSSRAREHREVLAREAERSRIAEADGEAQAVHVDAAAVHEAAAAEEEDDDEDDDDDDEEEEEDDDAAPTTRRAPAYTVHRLSGKRRRRSFEHAPQRSAKRASRGSASSSSSSSAAQTSSGSMAAVVKELQRSQKRRAPLPPPRRGRGRRTALIRSESESGMTAQVVRRLGRKGGGLIVGELMYGDLRCQTCGSGDDERAILICERCNSGFHLYCLRPVLPAVPPDSWFCSDCDTHTRRELEVFEQCKRKWFAAPPREVYRFFGLQGVPLTAHPTPPPEPLAKLEKSRLSFRLPRPSVDLTRRLVQYASLASAMDSKKMRFELNLWYQQDGEEGSTTRQRQRHPSSPSEESSEEEEEEKKKKKEEEELLLCRPADNHYELERSQGELDDKIKVDSTPIQPLSSNNRRLFEHFKRVCTLGESAPLLVKHNGGSGFMVVADDPIPDRTILCEYVVLCVCVCGCLRILAALSRSLLSLFSPSPSPCFTRHRRVTGTLGKSILPRIEGSITTMISWASCTRTKRRRLSSSFQPRPGTSRASSTALTTTTQSGAASRTCALLASRLRARCASSCLRAKIFRAVRSCSTTTTAEIRRATQRATFCERGRK